MSAPSARVQQLVGDNVTFAESYQAPFTMKQMREAGGDVVLVLTCIDPRVVPEVFLGPTAQVAVFRNAGGRANSDVIRTITVLRSLAYKAKQISVMVIHHTDDGIREDVCRRDPEDAAIADGIDFGSFKDSELEEVILQDVDFLKASSLLKGVDIRGYVLTTETGLLREL